jgi:uncharacterized protein (TIGR02246 family)
MSQHRRNATNLKIFASTLFVFVSFLTPFLLNQIFYQSKNEKMKKLFIAAMLLLTTTFSMNVNAQKISDADDKSIGKMYQEMMMAFGKFDAVAFAGFYTDNGTHISPDGQIVTGRAALKEFYEKLFAWFKTLPKPDKTDMKQSGWNPRYLNNDLIIGEYTEEHTNHFGNKVEKEMLAFSVLLKRTNNGWLCEQVTMTPVKPMQ